MTEVIDVLVVGAGVVGLAIAREFARQGREVLLLEQHSSIGTEISSRNSEVIHSGIYYPRHSMKAKLCVRGKALLYAYCESHGVAHQRCGKLILATHEDQFDTLRAYQRRAIENEAGELQWMDAKDVAVLEPEVFCLAGIYSESTGIIDTHAFMLSLLGELEANAGSIALNSALTAWSYQAGRIVVDCDDFSLAPKLMINACGLNAPRVANMHRSIDNLQAHYAKGHYYTLTGASPFKHLVYPVAEPGGLGVHVTLDLAGQTRFGPDVCWIDSVDYSFDDTNKGAFVQAIRKYYPALKSDMLQMGYTGIRPKLGPAGCDTDFLLETEDKHGVPGLVNLAGIESPGLTSALAIAECVYQLDSPAA